MGVKITNNAFGTISAGISSSDTTITLDSGQGARFPSLSSGDFFFGTLVDTSNNIEIVKVTARSTDSMTVTRAQDNTTARAYAIGDRFELRPTAALFEEVINVVNDTTPQLGGDLDGQGNNIYSLQGNIGSDSGDYLTFTTNTRMDVYVNGSNEFRFESDGDFHADGDVIAYSTTTASDEKLKENIETVSNALDKCNSLKGITFNWKRDGQASAGVIAQNVQEVLPQAVKQVTGMTGDNHLTVNYNALTSILIEAVKELSARVEELEKK